MTSNQTWFTANQINPEHLQLPIRQVYLWFITSDNQIAIVGRGDNWQFPGGKPENRESIDETLNREIYEEAGLKLSDYQAKPQFFGYYLVEKDVNPQWPSGNPYLQVRYFIKVKNSSDQIQLSVNERAGDIDTLAEAKFVDLYKLNKHISWVDNELEEYLIVLKLIKLRQSYI